MNKKAKEPKTSEVKSSIQTLIDTTKLGNIPLNKEDDKEIIDLSNSECFIINTGKRMINVESSILKKIAKMKTSYPNTNLMVVLKKKKVSTPFNKVIRVGTNFFNIDKTDNLVRTNKQCIEDDYGQGSSKDVEIFLGFKNSPEHINYKENINGYRNLYQKISHVPKKGDWKIIDKMLKHIFRDENYEMILTYFWVLYNSPKHPLPFIGLVSKLKNTGKTTFLAFIKLLLEYNAKMIDPEDLSKEFNSGFIDKLAILIDESIEGKNRRKDLQKLKKYITGGWHGRKAKFQDDIDIELFGKFIMASNDVETVLSIEDENTRFWIVEVEKLEEDIFDFKNKLKSEIPAFLYFLANEYNPISKKDRLWLDPNAFQTERSRILQQNSRSTIIKELTDRLIDYFTEFESEDEIKFTSNHFIDAFSNNRDWNSNYLSREIRSYFDKTSKKETSINPFYSETKYIVVGERDNSPRQGRFYTFTRKEVAEFSRDVSLEEKQ